MNKKAILEIGRIIHITRNLKLRKLSAKEIIDSFEYNQFKRKYPKICELCEGQK